METVLLIANKKDQALFCVGALCEDIKNNEEANHKLKFASRMFSSYLITNETDREIEIFPAAREEDLERLQRNKNIVLLKNCMWCVGDSDLKKSRRDILITWLLGVSSSDHMLAVELMDNLKEDNDEN